MSTKRRRVPPEASPSASHPTPSPQMGRLQFNSGSRQCQGVMPPPPTAPKSASSSRRHNDSSQPSPGMDLLADCLQQTNRHVLDVGRGSLTISAAPSVVGASSNFSQEVAQPIGTPVPALPPDWALKRGCVITSTSDLSWCTKLLPSFRAAALQSKPLEAVGYQAADVDGDAVSPPGQLPAAVTNFACCSALPSDL